MCIVDSVMMAYDMFHGHVITAAYCADDGFENRSSVEFGPSHTHKGSVDGTARQVENGGKQA